MSGVVIVGGVHGAGKSTLCTEIAKERHWRYLTNQVVRRELGNHLSRPEVHSILKQQIEECLKARTAFVFEHVMSGHFVAKLIQMARERHYSVHLVYVDIPDADTAVARVDSRLDRGGHDVERDRVAQRLRESRHNFWTEYRAQADRWSLYDNSGLERRLVAHGDGRGTCIVDAEAFERFRSRVEGSVG